MRKRARRQARAIKHFDDPVPGKIYDSTDPEFQPDWDTPCMNCGELPIVPVTGLCGPCTYGEADTAGGNW